MTRPDRSRGGLLFLLAFFAATTAAILHLENGFPYVSELYLGTILRLLVFLVAATRWGRWMAPMSIGPTLSVGLISLALLWLILVNHGVDTPVATTLVLLPSILWRPREIKSLIARIKGIDRATISFDTVELLFVVLIVVGLLTQFFSVLSLPTGAGALSGHLFEADQAILGGETPSPFAALIMPELILDPDGMLTNVTGFAFFLILIVSLDSAARRHGLPLSSRLI